MSDDFIMLVYMLVYGMVHRRLLALFRRCPYFVAPFSDPACLYTQSPA
jgi:hypothetical protein